MKPEALTPPRPSPRRSLRRGMSVRSGILVALISAVLFVSGNSRLWAQSGGPGFSFDPDDRVQAGAGLDSISPYNGALSLAIPIGPAYQVGPGLAFQLRLYYSSRIWVPGTWQLFDCNPTCTPAPNMLLDGDPALGLGWRLGFGSIVEAAAGVPAAYIAPDGSAHRLYNRRFFCQTNCPRPDGFFYTRDGSYLRVQYFGSTSGYKMWTPDGNLTTLAQKVKGFDNPPASYITDFGRGRDGWHATRIENPYGDAITIAYQSSGPNTPYAWVPYHVAIPSINGTGARDIWINISGSHVDNIQLPTFGGVGSTYTLHHRQSPWQLFRPIPHPTAYVTEAWYLDRIDLPLGYSYSFAYFENPVSPPQTVYANGAMANQTVPTGARIDYAYGTWTWYHANPLNRPVNCGYPIVPYPTGRPVLKTGPNTEPSLTDPGVDCGAADRAAGVVQRSVSYTTLTSNDTATTKYFQYDYPNGESLTDTSAQSQTLVLSPADAANNQHSTTYLFSVSTETAISGPLVGALLRMALYSGNPQIPGGPGGPPSILDTSFALRVQRFSYAGGTDPYDTNPFSPSSEAFEANRRVTRSVTIFSGIPPTSPPSGKYHQIDYAYNATAGRYQSESHSGTVGGDSRYAQTDWTPDTTNWKLDKPAVLYLRVAAGGSNFSTVSNSFDSHGFPISSTITDVAGGYGTLTHSTPRDATHGFPSSETFTHGGSSYTRILSFAAGSLKTSKWNGMLWLAANNDIDSSTGFVRTSTDPSGLSTTFTFDALGRPLRTTPPGGDAVTEITYISPTQTTVRTPPSSDPGPEYAWTQTFTDSLGRPIKVQQKMPGGAISKKITRYDRQGRVVFESEWVDDSVSDSSPPPPGTSLTDFDHFGRPKTITRADGKTTVVDYSDGTAYPNSVWLKTVTVSGVGGGSAVTKYTSDAFGNLIKVTETPDGVASWDTTYTYNPQDRLIGVNQGSGTQTRSYVYDAFGFLRKENFPEKRNQDVTYPSYDALGNVLTETQPGSLTITRIYDTAGRLKSLAAGGQTYLTNDYDGQVVCVIGPDGCPNGGAYGLGKLTRQVGYNPMAAPAPPAVIKQDFFYDDRAGRLSSRETRVYNGTDFLFDTQTERWTYDLAGELVQYDHPRASGLFSVATSYDHGLPVAVRANGVPVVVSATYQRSGLLASYVTGNDTGHNVRTDIGADPNSIPRPGSFTTSGASQNFASGTYYYDGAGNITAIGTDSFGYDRLSRLTSASYSGLGSQGFSYDQYANLTSTSGVNPRAYTVDNHYNQLTFSGADPVTYDARGNLGQIGNTTPPKEKYTWDALDRTVRYQTVAGADWKYLYNGASERLVKIPASGAASDYVWTFRDETNRIATEYLGSTLSRDNVYLGNLLVGSYSSCPVNGPPGWTFYSSDHLGTPRLITDAGGTKLDIRKYWPYGDEATGSGNAAQRLRFASMERDTEGTRYFDHARSYDFSAVGRFISPDPMAGSGFRPQSWNKYSYVQGGPINFTDPLGLDIDVSVVFVASGPTLLDRIAGGEILNGSFSNGDLIIEGQTIPGFLLGRSMCEVCPGTAGESLTREEAARQIFAGVANLTEAPVNFMGHVLMAEASVLLPEVLFGSLAATTGSYLSSSELAAVARVAAVQAKVAQAAAKMEAIREAGRVGERLAGIVKNTKRIPSLTGTAKYRVPDILDRAARVIGDVKNRAYVGLTNQMRDLLFYAANDGYRFDLIVRFNTELHPVLEALDASGAINVIRMLP